MSDLIDDDACATRTYSIVSNGYRCDRTQLGFASPEVRIAVTFGELPPSRPGLLDRFADVLDVLRDAPGEWASIAHYPSRAGAWYPRRELTRLLDDFEFDVRSTSSPEGSVLWARYTGES